MLILLAAGAALLGALACWGVAPEEAEPLDEQPLVEQTARTRALGRRAELNRVIRGQVFTPVEAPARAASPEAEPAPAPVSAPARLRGRVTDASGTPQDGVEIRRVEPGGTFSDKLAATDKRGWYEVRQLKPGEHLFYADTFDVERTALSRVRLRAGEVRRLDLVVKQLPAVQLNGRVVDRHGRPISWVTVKVRPRHAPGDDRARYLLSRATDVTSSSDGSFSLPLAEGWYTVRLLASSRSAGAGGQTTVYVQQGLADQVVIYGGHVVSCTLHTPQGRPVTFSGYSMSVTHINSRSGLGMLGGGTFRRQALRFPWPPGAASVSVSLSGSGISGDLVLRRPGQRCRIAGQPTKE